MHEVGYCPLLSLSAVGDYFFSFRVDVPVNHVIVVETEG